MMLRKLFVFLLISTVLAACAPAAVSTPTPQGEKGPLYVSSAELLIMESFPIQVRVHITGDLPTPCHKFRAEVSEPDAQNRIYVSAFSLSNPELMCAQVLQPFDESIPIPMSGQADGTYSVYLNGELVGQFEYSE